MKTYLLLSVGIVFFFYSCEKHPFEELPEIVHVENPKMSVVQIIDENINFRGELPTNRPIAGYFNNDALTDIAYIGEEDDDSYLHWYIHLNSMVESFVFKDFTSNHNTSHNAWFAKEIQTNIPIVGFFNNDSLSDIAYWGKCNFNPPLDTCWRIHFVGLSDMFIATGDFGDEMWFVQGEESYNNTPMAGDFNGDGLSDIAYWGKKNHDNEQGWRTHINAVDEDTFDLDLVYDGEERFLTREDPTTIPMVGDFNKDGYADIVYKGTCMSGSGECWIVHINTRSEGFEIVDYGGNIWFSGNDYDHTNTPMVGDFNGDGYSDIVYKGKFQEGGPDCWRVHLNNKEGGFDVEAYGEDIQFNGTGPTSTPMVGDFDGDGQIDDIAYYGDCGGATCWRIHLTNL